MKSKDKSEVQGEGDYRSAKIFQDAEHAFAANGPVKEKAREAADALSGPKAAELEAARRAAAQGKTPPKSGSH